MFFYSRRICLCKSYSWTKTKVWELILSMKEVFMDKTKVWEHILSMKEIFMDKNKSVIAYFVHEKGIHGQKPKCGSICCP